MEFSLGSGRVHSTVFVEPFVFHFFYPLRSFRQLLGVIPFGKGSGVLQVVLLSLTPGVAALYLSVSEPAVPALLWFLGRGFFVLSSLLCLLVPFTAFF